MLLNNKHHMICVIGWFCWLQMANGEKKTDDSERILSRQRRYLVFPAGSSIQFVTDIDMYFPGWTPSYPITGFSLAMAWGLPDKPFYPEDDLMHLYEDDKLPSIQRRNDTNATNNIASNESNATTAPTETSSRIDPQTVMKLIRLFLPNLNSAAPDDDSMGFDANYVEAIVNYVNSFDHNIRRQDSNKYWHTSATTNNHAKPNDFYQFTHPPLVASQSYVKNRNVNHNAYDAFQRYLATTYFRSWIESTSTKKTMTATAEQSKMPKVKPKINKFHRIYPAIGKRSIRSAHNTREEKFYLDHHRNTRHELYESIEKYLFAKGYNGTACVLKTLCEVGKKRSDKEPSIFLAELIRVLFSLPDVQSKRVIDKRYVHYDEAHRSTDDCTKLFDQCPNSVWEAGFMIEYYD